ncbi:lipopolysaccharide biosynthesis regulator YciM [Sinobacterium caligoides]|uniref:Lipopolysaccharide assembly protein B n=1 Tax=Sinobacterium caligoides TaxID=933926 RepID=A0A3N2DZ54_9GAMM|nr:lipopolysaccharide assembly protein LapB [Sinobacterium caligoides]ROS05128.1 lipopolysaccharide biosynthesis regulator YciM [Sinobacterium caligoides]
MPDLSLLFVIFVAVAIGWLLGRYRRPKRRRLPDSPVIPMSYYRSLNLLMSKEDGDEAVDSFMESFEVSSVTLPTHISMGDLLRERGDVEGAIKVHQNLLARPSLSVKERHMAHFALARDYAQAGLLDRAESLFKQLVSEQSELSTKALSQLVDIYQEQRDWQLAIDTGMRLVPRRLLRSKQAQVSTLGIAMAHYCCELAEQEIVRDDWRRVRLLLKQALDFDRSCVRASLILGRVEMSAQRYHQAIKVLGQVQEQDLLYMSEAIGMIARCYQQLNDVQGFIVFAEKVLRQQPMTAVLMELIWGLKSQQGEKAAAERLSQLMRDRPTIQGLISLVDFHQLSAIGSAAENLQMLRDLLEGLLAHKPQYRCRECGFAGQQLHWLCPSCKGWGVVAPIVGVEGQ